MNFLIAGGTGLIGQKLIQQLIKENHHIFCLTRSLKNKKNTNNLTFIQWMHDEKEPYEELKDKKIDVVINLAGKSLNSGRWTEKRKKEIVESRINATASILTTIKNLTHKPTLFLNASAIGIYGISETITFNETYSPGDDFLASTVAKWEECAKKATTYSIRTVYCRFGVVLSNKGGALPKLMLPYQLFIGGKIGRGKQWVSWIHIEDCIKAMLFIIDNPTIQGPVNFTAPQPVTMKQIGEVISRQLHRPNWLPIPSFFLKTLLGEMSILITEGQCVEPKVLTQNNFSYTFPSLQKAIADLY
ncbi:TIGR01777 family oxidoreductase [Niallia nealsonii]|uniref:TIGR01777 family protein n=1 Tax=Niallia nealsonii TaxID=115979 RepID=A0A2N0YXN2_9BACI|nr:TIGR01777 family oxidoreductase [Niallia nealsonii]PKG22024.1 TIGR01777 family protein [Niallia nealsonii]